MKLQIIATILLTICWSGLSVVRAADDQPGYGGFMPPENLPNPAPAAGGSFSNNVINRATAEYILQNLQNRAVQRLAAMNAKKYQADNLIQQLDGERFNRLIELRNFSNSNPAYANQVAGRIGQIDQIIARIQWEYKVFILKTTDENIADLKIVMTAFPQHKPWCETSINHYEFAKKSFCLTWDKRGFAK
ncbi:MAG: hypothetical protein HZA88_10580 [Verrucomicrobia bacterium]|nr:hypothetical protein [Verrucomicrobiota bacterium]